MGQGMQITIISSCPTPQIKSRPILVAAISLDLAVSGDRFPAGSELKMKYCKKIIELQVAGKKIPESYCNQVNVVPTDTGSDDRRGVMFSLSLATKRCPSNRVGFAP